MIKKYDKWKLNCPTCKIPLTRLDLVRGSENYLIYRCPKCYNLWREKI